MVDWREGLRRSAVVTGRGYLIVSVILIGASAYDHGYAVRRHFHITFLGKSSDVVVFTDAEGKSHSIDCAPSDSKPPAQFAPRLPRCADVGQPESRLKGTWDWGQVEYYGGA